jgi:hypothetical protein
VGARLRAAIAVTILWTTGTKMAWIIACVIAAVAGTALGVMATLVLSASISSLPEIALLFCRDYPSWVEQQSADIPLGIVGVPEYGGPQRLWLRKDRNGYDDACRKAFERQVGPLPDAGSPLPDDPPGWHVQSRRYFAPGGDGLERWYVVYDGRVWRCSESDSSGDPDAASTACELDVDAPFPSPGYY